MKRKSTIAILFAMAGVLAIGWFTSTRHVDYQFLVNGQPLANREVSIIASKHDPLTNLVLDDDGKIRLPASLVGKLAAVSIEGNGSVSMEFVEMGFRRGETRLDFRDGHFESRYRYRFLFYSEEEESISMDLDSEDAEALIRR